MLSVLENLPSPIFRPSRSSRSNSTSESGVPKNWKSVKGCVGYRDPIFLKERNQGVRCKKAFANWLRVIGRKFNGSDWHLKMALIILNLELALTSIWSVTERNGSRKWFLRNRFSEKFSENINLSITRLMVTKKYSTTSIFFK